MATKKKAKKSRTKARRRATKRPTAGAGSQSMRVEVIRIKLYEGNPRRGRNPEYDRIKSSILMAGMDQPLRITQRPSETDYVVQAGGNTRLKILKELYETTGNERFYWVDCVFVEWDRESTVLLAHLRENELRGNLNFIDRAQAVMEIKALIAEESGKADMTQRRLEKTLKDQGYSASQGLISLMGFAYSKLLSLLPTALDAGLGKLQVQRIRKLKRVGEKIWDLRKTGPQTEFADVFAALCRRYDSEDWQLEPLRRAIEVEIAEAADVSIQVIRMEFDCRLAGHEPEIPEHVLEEQAVSGDFPVSRRDEPNIVSEAERYADKLESTGSNGAESQNETRAITSEMHDGPQISVDLPFESNREALFRHIGVQSKDRLPIELLRDTAYQLALRLARRHGMTELVRPLPNNGLGFLVSDLPDAEILENLDEDMLSQVSTVWWQLVALAEVAMAPQQAVLANLDTQSAIRSAVQSANLDRLIDKLSTVHPAYIAHRFYRRLNHEDWCDWLCLAHNYRELHRVSKQLNKSLWSEST